MEPLERIFIQSIPKSPEQPVLLRGWVQRLRVLGKTTFLVLKDCSGQAQCVAAPELLKNLRLKSEDTVEIEGRVRLGVPRQLRRVPKAPVPKRPLSLDALPIKH